MNKSRRTVIFGAIAGLSAILTLSKTQAKQIDNSKMLLDRSEIIDAVNIIGMGADLFKSSLYSSTPNYRPLNATFGKLAYNRDSISKSLNSTIC